MLNNNLGKGITTERNILIYSAILAIVLIAVVIAFGKF